MASATTTIHQYHSIKFVILLISPCLPHWKIRKLWLTHYQCVSQKTSAMFVTGPGKCHGNFKSTISEHLWWIKFMSTSCKIALRWMPQITFDDKLTLVQVMAWCHQATSHYLNQSWLRSMLPYGTTRLQWVNCYYLYIKILYHIVSQVSCWYQAKLLLTQINWE